MKKTHITRRISKAGLKLLKKNKISFFAKHAKWFLFAISFIAILGLACLIVGVTPQKIAQGETKTGSVARLVVQGIKNGIQLASSDSSKAFYPNLSEGVGVYVFSKNGAPCKDYGNTTRSKTFGFRCQTLNAIWRGLWTKKIDVAGYSKLRIEASLGVNNYSKNYFPECGGRGVDRDNVVDLIVLSSDPEPKLDAECNHHVEEDMWHRCLIINKDVSAITHCGVPQCSSVRSCDMEIDVSGLEDVYMLFALYDDWFADIEGTLSNMKITLTK
ncbi:hypothetical protein KJ885_01205 [Patescibacteria group bacterium]|nr:hypothetical protein [Patescibacteria group bacterium]